MKKITLFIALVICMITYSASAQIFGNAGLCRPGFGNNFGGNFYNNNWGWGGNWNNQWNNFYPRGNYGYNYNNWGYNWNSTNVMINTPWGGGAISVPRNNVRNNAQCSYVYNNVTYTKTWRQVTLYVTTTYCEYTADGKYLVLDQYGNTNCYNVTEARSEWVLQ